MVFYKNIFLSTCCFFLFVVCVSCKKDPPLRISSSVPLKAGETPDTNYVFDLSQLLSSNSTFLDIDHDGTPDLSFISTYDYHIWLRENNNIAILNSNFEIRTTSDSTNPEILNYGDVISNSSSWISRGSSIMGQSLLLSYYMQVSPSPPTILGNWYKKTGYIGFRKYISSGVYRYGWIYLYVSDYYMITFYRYYFK